MAYRLTGEDKSLEAALRRIAGEQVDKALHSIEHDDRSEAVHEVRRRCKALRGLIRLVRTAFADFEKEDAAFKDLAKPLSRLRDTKVMLDTLGRIGKHAEGKEERHLVRAFRTELTGEFKAVGARENDEDLLEEAHLRFMDARDRAQKWRLDDDGWGVVGKGVAITYDHARETLNAALAEGAPRLFHELRKHLRFHWCHAKLLRPLWPGEMEARARLAADLDDILGYHHDLSVLAVRLDGQAGPDGGVAPVLALIARESAALEARAAELAGRLLAETTRALDAHWHALWDNWQATGASPHSLRP